MLQFKSETKTNSKYNLINHTGIGEQESWIIERHDRAGYPVDVVLVFEEFEVGVADFSGRPLKLLRIDARHG